MSTITILIIVGVFLIGIGLGAMIIFVVLRRRSPSATVQNPVPVKPRKPDACASVEIPPSPSLPVFRWRYVAAPLLLAGVCVVFALAFIAFLPNPMAFRFNSDGSVLTSMNTAGFVILMLSVQMVSALAAIAIAQTIVKVSKNMFKASEAPTRLDGFISLMTNMVLLPQLILAYIMLDAFIYGVWTRHVISVGLFSILIIGIGSLILIYMFVRLLPRAGNVMNK